MAFNKHGTGWIVDFPDIRDYTPKSNKIKTTFASAAGVEVDKSPQIMESRVDNSKWCSPIKNQGLIGACTAFAGVGMYEYMENKIHGKHLEGSELFVYKNTRLLMSTRGELSTNGTGDTGGTIRAALGSLAFTGVAPADSYPYIEKEFDNIPNNFVYALGQNYQITQYFRLDYDIAKPQDNLQRIKEWVYRGFPIVFGFTCYKGVLEQAIDFGDIPFPSNNDTAVGGHAVMVCGYDDAKGISNSDNGQTTTGAFLIRNSWGDMWGDNGYGNLPYEYILSGHGLAQDFWTIVKFEWIDKDQFHF